MATLTPISIVVGSCAASASPFQVVTNLQEAVWDADIVINGLPSTEAREVFEEISKYWKEWITVPVIISLAKGVEAELGLEPRITTLTLMINRARSLFDDTVDDELHVSDDAEDDMADFIVDDEEVAYDIARKFHFHPPSQMNATSLSHWLWQK